MSVALDAVWSGWFLSVPLSSHSTYSGSRPGVDIGKEASQLTHIDAVRHADRALRWLGVLT